MMAWNMTFLSHVVILSDFWSPCKQGVVAAQYYHHPVAGYLLHLPIAGPRTGPFFGVATISFEKGV